MAAAKITINSNGSIRVEGDFEIVDPEGRVFRACWAHCHWPLPLRPFGQQAVLRRLPQGLRLHDPVVARELPAPKPKI